MIGILLFLFFSSPTNGETSVNCAVVGNGNYEIGCKSYVVCTNGVKSYKECGIGEVYNNATNGCYDDAKVGLPCGLFRDCANRANKKYADLESQCTSYYTCQFGNYFGHNFCSPGTVFDEFMQLCNWPVNVKPPCGVATTTTATTTTT